MNGDYVSRIGMEEDGIEAVVSRRVVRRALLGNGAELHRAFEVKEEGLVQGEFTGQTRTDGTNIALGIVSVVAQIEEISVNVHSLNVRNVDIGAAQKHIVAA